MLHKTKIKQPFSIEDQRRNASVFERAKIKRFLEKVYIHANLIIFFIAYRPYIHIFTIKLPIKCTF